MAGIKELRIKNRRGGENKIEDNSLNINE